MELYDIDSDLTHLVGPLTLNTVVKRLQQRFTHGKYKTLVGPVILSVNPYHAVPGPVVLCDTDTSNPSPEITQLVNEVLSYHRESKQSQVIILSGESGSGKTFCSLQILHHLFSTAGGGLETDTSKHLSATLTVLQSLCTATTSANRDSSRVGFFFTNSVSNGAIFRTRVNCYFVEQCRVSHVKHGENNYHIFYQALAGLTAEEKLKYHLSGLRVKDLSYLRRDNCVNTGVDRARFTCWKASLGMLGITFSDVMRILAAVLLLGNVEFIQNDCHELEVNDHKVFHAVAALLGIPAVVLYRGLTSRTRTIRGEICKSSVNTTTAEWTRDLLAQALYCRTVKYVTKAANSRSQGTESQHSSDSMEISDTNEGNRRGEDHFEKSYVDPTPYLGHDGFIGVLDMFGFEQSQTNQLSQLCINLCSEKLQCFYNTLVFKDPIDACNEEGITANSDLLYTDNMTVIDLIDKQGCGILELLDGECRLAHNNPALLIARIRSLHTRHKRLFEGTNKTVSFGIRHYGGGSVVYDAQSLLQQNRASLPDDVVCMFSETNCNFGFISSLFIQELKNHHGGGFGPRGIIHSICPYSKTSRHALTLTASSDFCHQLNQLITTLKHTQPHFIRCIKSNGRSEAGVFDSAVVLRQLQSLQVLETVKLMAGGLPHRLSYQHFNKQYHLFLKRPSSQLPSTPVSECKLILRRFLEEVDCSRLPYISVQWALGKRHIFFSEGCRQQLNRARKEKIDQCACVIQSVWRGCMCRRKLNKEGSKLGTTLVRNKDTTRIPHCQETRPTPTPRREFPKYVKDTCKQLDLSVTKTPPVPRPRKYTVYKNMKVYYPQIRILTKPYQDPESGHVLYIGDEVEVVGTNKGGLLLVRHRDKQLYIPHQILQIKEGASTFHLDV